MALVIPFKSYFYNQKNVDLSKVLTPPYDIISPEKQDYYYSISPYNVIRAILGKEETGDNERENKYIRAKNFWDTLIKEKIVVKDDSPCFYILEMEYFHNDKKNKLKGFVALFHLENFGEKVFPHERTLKKTKTERMILMQNLPVDFCPVLGLYQDDKKEICRIIESKTKDSPLISIKDEEGTTHNLWKLTEEKEILKIKEEMKEKIIFIGDGHHRYEVALKYREQMKKENQKNTELHNYIMVYFVDMNEEGVTILPSHRLIKKNSFELSTYHDKLNKFFEIEILNLSDNYEFLKILNEQEETTFVMYTGGENCYLLKLKDKNLLNEIEDDIENIYWKELDVGILHNLFIKHILGEENPYEGNIEYLRDTEKTIELVRKDKFKIALFHKPTKISDLKKISSAGGIMPPKSTYFHPKPLSGLLMMSRTE